MTLDGLEGGADPDVVAPTLTPMTLSMRIPSSTLPIGSGLGGRSGKTYGVLATLIETDDVMRDCNGDLVGSR